MYILVQTPLSIKLRSKDSVSKMHRLFFGCTAFSNIHMSTTEFCTALEKLYILVHTSFSMKSRVHNSVPKIYSFFLWLYSFLMVLQLFKNIHMRTTEFVRLWKKMYILVQTPLSMKLRAKDSRTTEFVWLWKKMYILVQTPLSIKLRAKDSVPKMYSFFLWMYSFFL